MTGTTRGPLLANWSCPTPSRSGNVCHWRCPLWDCSDVWGPLSTFGDCFHLLVPLCAALFHFCFLRVLVPAFGFCPSPGLSGSAADWSPLNALDVLRKLLYQHTRSVPIPLSEICLMIQLPYIWSSRTDIGIKTVNCLMHCICLQTLSFLSFDHRCKFLPWPNLLTLKRRLTPLLPRNVGFCPFFIIQ